MRRAISMRWAWRTGGVLGLVWGLIGPHQATATQTAVLDYQYLRAYARVGAKWSSADGYTSTQSLSEMTTGVAIATASRESDYTDPGYVSAHAIQSQGGFSVVSTDLADTVRPFESLRGSAWTNYTIGIHNDSSFESIPLSLTFTVFAGQVETRDENVPPLHEISRFEGSAAFTVRSSRPGERTSWHWAVNVVDVLRHGTAGSIVFTANYDPQGIGFPVMWQSFSDSLVVHTVGWNAFTATLPFAPLAPGESFELNYLIEADAQLERGVCIYSCRSGVTGASVIAGDPFSLEGGTPAGPGSQVVLRAGDQLFPLAPQPASEPATALLLGSGLAGLGALTWRRARRE